MRVDSTQSGFLPISLHASKSAVLSSDGAEVRPGDDWSVVCSLLHAWTVDWQTRCAENHSNDWSLRARAPLSGAASGSFPCSAPVICRNEVEPRGGCVTQRIHRPEGPETAFSTEKKKLVPASYQAPKSGLPCPDRSENLINGKSVKFYFDICIQKKSQNVFYHREKIFRKIFFKKIAKQI